MVVIESCTCSHVYQDKLYGKGKRVHNIMLKDNHPNPKGRLRCTVCAMVKP